ncbi:hypothetical protein F5887DRAFT_1080561 [Amanita rubescens]|nr:hypothetical protein F5887DRAFT_1080561 [Amanita rubescens]
MEESNSARGSSGVYDAAYGNSPNSASNASLRGHAVAPGFTTPPGAPTGVDAAKPTPAMDYRANSDPFPLPTRPPTPLYKRKWFIISQIILGAIGFAMIFILLWPVVRAVVQLVVNRTTLDIQVATVSNAANNSFTLNLLGNVAHTGEVHSTIKFTEPISVAWVYNGSTTQIGSMRLNEPFKARHGRAPLNQTTTFSITNATGFARFSEYLIASSDSNFTWFLLSHNLHVYAARFPVARRIKFKKETTLHGLIGFNSIVGDLQLPSDNPAG